MSRTMARAALVLGTLAGTSLLTSAPAQAGGDARVTGACTGGSVYELRATPSGGGIRVDFRVSTPFADRFWTTTISDNGTTVFTDGRQVANSFSLDVTTADRPGPDTIAVHSAFDALTCEASVTV